MVESGKEIMLVGSNHWWLYWYTTEELVYYFTCPECGGFLGERQYTDDGYSFRECPSCGNGYFSV